MLPVTFVGYRDWILQIFSEESQWKWRLRDGSERRTCIQSM